MSSPGPNHVRPGTYCFDKIDETLIAAKRGDVETGRRRASEVNHGRSGTLAGKTRTSLKSLAGIVEIR
jgi:hypothetical protein